MKRPPEPAPEELTGVANYWRWVEETVRGQGFEVVLQPPKPPQEVFEKVAQWKQWRDLMNCQHNGGITFDSGRAEMTCSDCGDPMSFLSETQFEEMRRRSEHE